VSAGIAVILFSGIILKYSTEGQATGVAEIHPALLKIAVEGVTDSLHVWIHMKDRGLGQSEVMEALDSVRVSIDPRALQRRRMRGRITGVVSSDLPPSALYIETLEKSGLRLRQKSRWLNAVSGVVAASDLDDIAGHSFVARISPLGRGRRIEPEFEPVPLPDRSAPPPSATRAPGQISGPEFYGYAYTQINSLQVPELHARGLTGAGVIVGVLDGGFKPSHAALSGLTVVDQFDFVNGDGVVMNEPGDPFDAHNHGTSVWSVLAGLWPGQLVGPAHGASFLLAKTEDVASETPVEEDNWVAAIEWMEQLGVDVVNTSLGYYNWYTYRDMDGDTAPITIAADAAAARGVLVVTSAGNDGGIAQPPHPDSLGVTYYVGAPADGDSVLAVGATDSYGIRTGFSSHGPTFDGRIKPDVMAQGIGIAAALAGGDSSITLGGSGTSYSSPLVAGVAALIVEAHPEWQVMDIIEALRATADRSGNLIPGEPDNDYGWGHVRGADAEGYPDSLPGPDQIIRFFNYPNPFSGQTTFRCEMTESVSGTISIFTMAGTFVRQLDVEIINSTTVEAVWDGRNAEGRIVAAAAYMAVIDLHGTRASTVVIRIP
jgi:subtilisin family serine protease